jgi:hypothetical protein
MDQRERHFPFVKILAESFSLKVLFSDQLGLDRFSEFRSNIPQLHSNFDNHL